MLCLSPEKRHVRLFLILYHASSAEYLRDGLTFFSLFIYDIVGEKPHSTSLVCDIITKIFHM